MNSMSKVAVAAVLLVGAGFGVAGAEAQSTWSPRMTSTPYSTCVQQATQALQADYARLHQRWQQSVATGDASTTTAADRAVNLDIAQLADC